MINLLNTSAYIASSIVFAILIYLVISLMISNTRIKKTLAQSQVEKLALIKKIEELSEKVGDSSISNTEGFVRFISESRDMAFKYIEDVQKSISDLKDYFDKNGLNLTVDKAEEMTKRIEEVIEYLPENSKND
jgi:hypothetical protein